MRNRCNNPNDAFYARYGGRGIRICEEWSKFENFLKDLGPKPTPEHTLDRVDNDGHYEPSNCRWASPTVQANNRSSTAYVTYLGKTQSIAAWANELGCEYLRLYDRLRPRAHLTIDEAFATFV